jgi:hypothetical protein
VRTFLLSSSLNSPGRFNGRDFQGGEGIGRSSGSLITRNGVCFTVSFMPVGGGTVSRSDSSAGESGRRSSQRAGARTYGAGPLVLEERGGMGEEAKGTLCATLPFLYITCPDQFSIEIPVHTALLPTYPIYPILSYPVFSCVLSAPPRLHPTPNPAPRTQPSSFTSTDHPIKKKKMGTKPEKKNEAHSV